MQIATRVTLFSLIFSFTLSTLANDIITDAATAASLDADAIKAAVKAGVKEGFKEALDEKQTTKNLPALAQLIQQKIAEYKLLISEHKIAAALIVAAVIVFMISIFRFNCKEPQKEPVNRYSLTFKDLKLRSIEDVNGLREQIRYILRNTHYIIEDGIIGRPCNSSTSMGVDKETGKVFVKDKCPPQGVYGYIHSYLKPITTTLQFPFEAGKVIATACAGVYILANPDILAKLIATTATQPKPL